MKYKCFGHFQRKHVLIGVDPLYPECHRRRRQGRVRFLRQKKEGRLFIIKSAHDEVIQSHKIGHGHRKDAVRQALNGQVHGVLHVIRLLQPVRVRIRASFVKSTVHNSGLAAFAPARTQRQGIRVALKKNEDRGA